MRDSLLTLVMLAAQSATAADDPFRVVKLEQDMRNLERQVQVLSRQVDELKQQLTRAGSRDVAATRLDRAPRAADSTSWLDATKWQRVRVGMSELEVIGLLGPPTLMRQEGGQRLLLYALEIGASGFLSGSVTLQDRAVTQVAKPVLQ